MKYLNILNDIPKIENFFCYVQTPKVFVNFKRMRRRECGRTHSVCLYLAGTRTVAHATNRTHFYPEYGSTFRKDAITLFSTSSMIVGPEFESRNLILLTRNWTMRDLIRGQGENPRSLDLINKSENDFC